MLNRSTRLFPLSGTSIKKWLTDTTGISDQRDQFSAALTQTAASGDVLVIDCPVKIDANGGREIYIPDGAKIAFNPNGRIDGLWTTTPLFVSLHSNFQIFDLDLNYVGTGIDANVDYSVSPGSDPASSFLGRIKTRMISSFGNTFGSSASPAWYGPHHMMSAFCLYGKTNAQFKGETKFRVPSDATVEKFMPWAISSKGQWNPNVTNISSGVDTTLPNVNISQPSLFIDDLYMDGVVMGIQGEFTVCEIQRTRSYRYSDIMTATGTLIGGANTNFPPPHLFYINGRTDVVNLSDVIDYGYWNSTNANPYARRVTTSGYCSSAKVFAQRGTIQDYKSYRPDGLFEILGDDLSYGKSSLIVDDFYAEYDSSICGYPAVRFPTNNYIGNTFRNGKIVDLASTSLIYPFGSNNSTGNRRVVISNVECEMQDFSGTQFPGCYINGSSNVIEMTTILKNHTQTQTYRGVVAYEGTAHSTIANTKHKVDVIGWRNFTSDVVGLKNRVLINGGTSLSNPNNNIVEVNDITNGHYIKQVNGVKNELWTQRALIGPIANASSVPTTIIIPSGWTVVEVATGPRFTIGNSNGTTGYSVGWSGATDGLGTVIGLTNVNRTFLTDLPIVSSASQRQVIVTPIGGNFDGTGTIEIIVTCKLISIGE